MKATDLRIGNYITTFSKDIIEEISSISKRGIKTIRITNPLKGIEKGCRFSKKSNNWGIPLTEEWLIKLGFIFESPDQGYIDFEGDFRLHIDLYNKSNMPRLETDFEQIFLPRCDYVHEMQNLCYVFGKELTIKE